MALPAVAALCVAATAQWRPTGDVAIEALRTGDVGGPHTPLVGPYSRFGWSHPGPMLFWIGRPLQTVLGSRGLLVVAALLNLAWGVASVAAARRIGGRSAAWILATCITVALGAAAPEALLHPWNPFVATFALLAFLLCAMAAADGARWALPTAAAAGSLAAQSHLGSAPMVGAGTAIALVWALDRRRVGRRPGTLHEGPRPDDARRRRADRSHRRWWVRATVAILLVAWSGPIIDQIANDPGNLSAIVSFSVDGSEPAGPLDDALDVAARELGLPPAWAGAPETLDPLPLVRPGRTWTLALVALVLVGAAAWTGRRRDREALRLLVAAGVLWCAALIALSRTVGLFFSYLVRWTWPVGIIVATAVLTAAWRGIGEAVAEPGPGRPARARWAQALATTAVLLAAIATAARVVAGPLPDERHSEAAVALTDGIREHLPAGDYALSWVDPVDLGALPIGVGADLVRTGWDIRFPADEATEVGGFRTGPPAGRDEILVVVDRSGPDVVAPPGAVPVTAFDSLSPQDRRRLDALEEQVRRDARLPPEMGVPVTSDEAVEDLAAAGARVTGLEEMRDLQRGGDAYEVWLVPGPR